MKGKTPVNKTHQKAKVKKISISRVILIIVAVVVASVFLIFSIYRPSERRKAPPVKQSGKVVAPEFRKDGAISIKSLKTSSVINLDIEVADDEAERMTGLMYRLSLPEMAGMFFIFEDEEPRSFWMKNTYISLDIIYINAEKKIVSIQKYTQPKTTFSIPSEKPAKYVLEVNAGFSDKYNINPGDQIELHAD